MQANSKKICGEALNIINRHYSENELKPVGAGLCAC